MVLNQAFGAPEQLPFDLRMNRVIKYEMRATIPEKAKERNKLQEIFEMAIRQILETTLPVLPATQIPTVDLASRLGEYELENVSSSDFAGNLMKGLITLKGSTQGIMSVPAHTSTVFLAVPATELKIDPSKIFKTAQEVFENTRWYNWKSVEANAPGFRHYSSRMFPLARTTLRIEQNSILIEDKHPGGSGRLFILRINQRGELFFASSYYTTSEDSPKNIPVFHLGAIIHFLWAFLCLVREYQEHLGYSGNYHICVAMTNTEKSMLGDFADGWPDIRKRNYIRGPEVFDEICYASNILIRRENVNLSELEYKIEPEILKNIAEEIARAYNQREARCFDRNTGKLPDNLWPDTN